MIKSTGIVRCIDTLGRLVIPMEIRRTYGIEEGTPMEIFTDGGRIILRKYEPFCTICGSSENMIEHDGAKYCKKCVQVLADKAL